MLVRFLGQLFIFVALLFAVLGAGLWGLGLDIMSPVGQLWFQIDSNSLSNTQAFIQRYINSKLWDVILVPILLLPTWKIICIIVLCLTLLGGGIVFFRTSSRRSMWKI